jgi:CheY-like chemotaxis protein
MQLNVLMVDDDAEFAEDMRVILQETVTLRRVGGTAAAAARILRQRPDILWLDLELDPFFANSSALEGLAFLRILRKRIDSRLPVIVVSAQVSPHVSPQMQTSLRDLGVHACLPKPPDIRKLLQALHAATLSKQRLVVQHP